MRLSKIGIGATALVGALTFVSFAQDQPQTPQTAPAGGTELRVGSDAPSLNLFDLKGQVIVLEFVNPTDQKWIDLHHDKRFGQDGKLKQTFERYKEEGIIWLTICPFNDPAAGQQAAGQDVAGVARMSQDQLRAALKDIDLDAPVLFDNGGKIMKSFGITEVPYLVVVDKQGKVAYVDAVRGEGGELVGLDNFDRAVGTAINSSDATTLPAGAPRDEQERQRLERERLERERLQREGEMENENEDELPR
jgi:hypothetical protein